MSVSHETSAILTHSLSSYLGPSLSLSLLLFNLSFAQQYSTCVFYFFSLSLSFCLLVLFPAWIVDSLIHAIRLFLFLLRLSFSLTHALAIRKTYMVVLATVRDRERTSESRRAVDSLSLSLSHSLKNTVRAALLIIFRTVCYSLCIRPEKV